MLLQVTIFNLPEGALKDDIKQNYPRLTWDKNNKLSFDVYTAELSFIDDFFNYLHDTEGLAFQVHVPKSYVLPIEYYEEAIDADLVAHLEIYGLVTYRRLPSPTIAYRRLHRACLVMGDGFTVVEGVVELDFDSPPCFISENPDFDDLSMEDIIESLLIGHLDKIKARLLK